MKIEAVMSVVLATIKKYSNLLSASGKGIKILEFSPDGTRRYEEFFPGNEYKTIRAEKKESYYDLVIFSMGLYRTWDFEGSLRECFSLLKPGGHLIVDCPMNMESQDQPDFWRMTPAALMNLLGECGFDHGEVTLWNETLTSGLVRKPK